jgi:inhibitor of KinA sporulation pathway (predicted exonuclease)
VLVKEKRKKIMRLNRLVNVIDVESTAWEKPEKPGKDEIQEIIEIGITVVDIKEVKIVDSNSIVVRPQRSRISKFCTSLTGWTQEQVDKGITFQEATKKLVKEFGSNDRLFISWGDFDRNQDYDVKYPFGPRHLNLKNLFTLLYGLDKELGMDKALDYLAHNGQADSNNIAKILCHIIVIAREKGLE